MTNPRTTSKGGNNLPPQTLKALAGGKSARVSVDWLRYSMPYLDNDPEGTKSIFAALPPDDRVILTGEAGPNARGYDACLLATVGRLHYHSKRREQKISVEFSGSDCAALYSMAFAWSLLWAHIEASGGAISTIHLAIDLFNHGADHQQLEDALQSGEASTQARSVYTFAGGEVGKGRQEGTTYVGKPQSNRQLRCYNKAAERGVDGDWTRIELVIKGQRAKQLVHALTRFSLAAVARSAIGEFVQWEGCDWWQAAMAGEIVELSPVGRKDTNTVEWLLTVVADVLKRELVAEREASHAVLLDTFAEIVWSEELARRT